MSNAQNRVIRVLGLMATVTSVMTGTIYIGEIGIRRPTKEGERRMRSKGYKCYNYHCKGRVGDSPLCGEPGDTVLSCQDKVVSTMTNADRIRAMSYKELAKLFTHIVADGCPPDMDWECTKNCDGWDACDACWERWLQQPAEEG